MKPRNSETRSDDNDDAGEYKCEYCGMKFDSLGDMKMHSLEAHLQKGETPEKSQMPSEE